MTIKKDRQGSIFRLKRIHPPGIRKAKAHPLRHEQYFHADDAVFVKSILNTVCKHLLYAMVDALELLLSKPELIGKLRDQRTRRNNGSWLGRDRPMEFALFSSGSLKDSSVIVGEHSVCP